VPYQTLADALRKRGIDVISAAEHLVEYLGPRAPCEIYFGGTFVPRAIGKWPWSWSARSVHAVSPWGFRPTTRERSMAPNRSSLRRQPRLKRSKSGLQIIQSFLYIRLALLLREHRSGASGETLSPAET
jgi:hypothetical protein